MLSGPLTMDPAKLAQAKADYGKDLKDYEPQLIDDRGGSNAQSPFVTQGDGSVYFNRWIDSENRNSAQNSWFDSTDKDGKTVRRPAWQAFPEYTYSKSNEQFDMITGVLKQLQGEGFKQMSDLYNKAIKKIK